MKHHPFVNPDALLPAYYRRGVETFKSRLGNLLIVLLPEGRSGDVGDTSSDKNEPVLNELVETYNQSTISSIVRVANATLLTDEGVLLQVNLIL